MSLAFVLLNELVEVSFIKFTISQDVLRFQSDFQENLKLKIPVGLGIAGAKV